MELRDCFTGVMGTVWGALVLCGIPYCYSIVVSLTEPRVRMQNLEIASIPIYVGGPSSAATAGPLAVENTVE